jgi:phage internal scaffolding protein
MRKKKEVKMTTVFVRSQYNYDMDSVSKETALECLDESKAQQHQRDESDINTIVKRFGLTGELPENVRMPQYGDFTGITDYQGALNAVKEAEYSFMQFPAEIRSRFNNDPEEFVAFCLDDRNRKEAEELGLVNKKEILAEGDGNSVARGQDQKVAKSGE